MSAFPIAPQSDSDETVHAEAVVHPAPGRRTASHVYDEVPDALKSRQGAGARARNETSDRSGGWLRWSPHRRSSSSRRVLP